MATRCSPGTSSAGAAAPLLLATLPLGGATLPLRGATLPLRGGASFAASSTGRSSAEASSTTGRSKLAASLSSTTRGAWSSSAARDSPGGSGANSGFPESDHLGATTSGDRSSPAPGGGADQMASPGTAL